MAGAVGVGGLELDPVVGAALGEELVDVGAGRVVGLVAGDQLLVLGEAGVADDDDQVHLGPEQVDVAAHDLVLLQRGHCRLLPPSTMELSEPRLARPITPDAQAPSG